MNWIGSFSICSAEMTLTTLISEPIERSIPPEITTTACAIAANTSGSAEITSPWTSNDVNSAGSVRQ